jgi:hypothetical protein
MTERLDRSRSGHRTARGHLPQVPHEGIQDAPPLPAPPPSYLSVGSEPTILGFPAEVAPDDGADIPAGAPELPRSPALVIVRRADPLAATPLVLAGVAATVSLLLPWSSGDGPTGLSLVDRGARDLGSGAAGDALWQPFAVVLCGGILVVLGFLMMVPARAHRAIGVLALAVALGAAASVAVLVVDTDLATERFGPGLWCAAAVPVLGLLGALKAMLTAPRVLLAPDGRRPVRARPRTVS